jgi:hypothetical protein
VDPNKLLALGIEAQKLQASGLDAQRIQAMAMTNPQQLASLLGIDSNKVAALVQSVTGVDIGRFSALAGTLASLDAQKMRELLTALGVDASKLQAAGLDVGRLQSVATEAMMGLMKMTPAQAQAMVAKAANEVKGLDPKLPAALLAALPSLPTGVSVSIPSTVNVSAPDVKALPQAAMDLVPAQMQAGAQMGLDALAKGTGSHSTHPGWTHAHTTQSLALSHPIGWCQLVCCRVDETHC